VNIVNILKVFSCLSSALLGISMNIALSVPMTAAYHSLSSPYIIYCCLNTQPLQSKVLTVSLSQSALTYVEAAIPSFYRWKGLCIDTLVYLPYPDSYIYSATFIHKEKL
jgi:hypothetical protein